MDQFGTSILMLAGAGERDRKNFASGSWLHHVYSRVLHGQFAAQVAYQGELNILSQELRTIIDTDTKTDPNAQREKIAKVMKIE